MLVLDQVRFHSRSCVRELYEDALGRQVLLIRHNCCGSLVEFDRIPISPPKGIYPSRSVGEIFEQTSAKRR